MLCVSQHQIPLSSAYSLLSAWQQIWTEGHWLWRLNNPQFLVDVFDSHNPQYTNNNPSFCGWESSFLSLYLQLLTVVSLSLQHLPVRTKTYVTTMFLSQMYVWPCRLTISTTGENVFEVSQGDSQMGYYHKWHIQICAPPMFPVCLGWNPSSCGSLKVPISRQ